MCTYVYACARVCHKHLYMAYTTAAGTDETKRRAAAASVYSLVKYVMRTNFITMHAGRVRYAIIIIFFSVNIFY